MLASMVDNPKPTRAETNDVANAILDGADCIMLSNETAVGKYPVKAVQEMARISVEMEKMVRGNVPLKDVKSIPETITRSIYHIAKQLDVNKVVTITKTGFTARMISRFRLDKPIIALTDSEKVKRQLEIVYGVKPVLFKKFPKQGKILQAACFCLRQGLVKKKDLVLFTGSLYVKEGGSSNSLQVHRVSEIMHYC